MIILAICLGVTNALLYGIIVLNGVGKSHYWSHSILMGLSFFGAATVVSPNISVLISMLTLIGWVGVCIGDFLKKIDDGKDQS